MQGMHCMLSSWPMETSHWAPMMNKQHPVPTGGMGDTATPLYKDISFQTLPFSLFSILVLFEVSEGIQKPGNYFTNDFCKCCGWTSPRYSLWWMTSLKLTPRSKLQEEETSFNILILQPSCRRARSLPVSRLLSDTLYFYKLGNEALRG